MFHPSKTIAKLKRLAPALTLPRLGGGDWSHWKRTRHSAMVRPSVVREAGVSPALPPQLYRSPAAPVLRGGTKDWRIRHWLDRAGKARPVRDRARRPQRTLGL